VLEAHPGDFFVLEISGTEVVPVEADSIRETARRGASVRITAVAKRAGPITGVYPLRSAPVSDPETSDDKSIAADRLAPEAASDDEAASPGQVELELEAERES